ncbi:MAG: sensor domain-containing diguanylate cyclase [Dehalococcoidia bacterium]|nr:MAG: sensor domain-containing diguanylate cyclase [Dehalococcoidia bacterium]
MKRATSWLRHAINPLVIQVATVAVAGIAVAYIAIFTSGIVERSSRQAADESNAALLATEIRAQVDSVALLRLDDASNGTGSRVTIQSAVAAHDHLAGAETAATKLHALVGSDVTLQILGATGEAGDGLDEYFAEQSPESFATLQARLDSLRALTAHEAPQLTADAQGHQDTLNQATSVARVASIIAATVAATLIVATTLITGRRLRHALLAAQEEKARLLATTVAMQRRNDQFAALYQVGSEVGESLNMRYVIDTTVREARKLVGADLVAVRRVVDGALQVAGTSHGDEEDVSGLKTVALGSGVTGRVAKRGKPIRIDSGGEQQMSDAERVRGIQSGIVVPLIVGARVVGTLGCWSRQPNKFDADDERILEMMATQVATALMSADTHERSERDAHMDTLTALPNRRQLSEDLDGMWLHASTTEQPHAIAMVDIDHFKRFNDEFGHKVGDITLQKVAEVLRSSIRDTDRLYRFGGEEFLIVFANVGSSMGLQLAERARQAVERTPLTGETLQPVGPVTISIGVALFPDHGRDFSALIDVADRAMYASKEAGRNRVTLAGHDLTELAAA